MPYRDREVRNARARERYHNDPELRTRHQQHYRDKYHNDPEFRKLRVEQTKQWHLNHPDQDKRKAQKYWSKLKLKVIQFLGGKCVYCGCDDPRALEVHHKNGGGYREQQVWGKRHMLQRKILTGERKIDDLELTCRACNANCHLKQKGVAGITVIWNPSQED